MSKKTLIAFVGRPASGKSTAIEAVKEFGTIITMGDVVREEASRLDLDPTPENIGKIARNLRLEYGDNVIAQRCIKKISQLEESVILIDGIRSVTEVKKFREYWSLSVIAITCSDELRIERIQARGRSDDSLDVTQIQERDKRELDFGLDDVIKNANYTVKNDQDTTFLVSQVRKLVKEDILT